MSMFLRRAAASLLYRCIPVILCALPAFAQFVPNRYILLLEDPPVASRFETRAQMQSAAGVQYRNQIEARQRAVLGELASRNIPVTGRVSTLLNAIFVIAPVSRISEMLAIPGVAAVRPMRRYHAALNRATQLMNAPAAWNSPAIGGQGNAGKGMKIAILDTGIDQTHPAFQDSSLSMPTGFPICTYGHPEDCAFTNSKVIVARSYVRQLAGFTSKDPKNLPDDTSVQPDPKVSQPDDYSPRDHVGHGTATASAAAANQNTGTVQFTGMAPKAYLGNYKIQGSPDVNDGASEGVMIKAIEDALNDGMDVASVSFGGQAFTGPLDTGAACGLPAGQPCDPMAVAYEAAVKAGMVVVVAAGNHGSDAVAAGGFYPYFNSMNSPSTAPSVISVGATTNSHALTPTVSVNSASAPSNVKSLAALPGDSFFFPSVLGASAAPLVDVTQLGNDGLACTALPAGSLNNAYALIERGTCNFSNKATNAMVAGAVGIVFYMADSSPTISPGGLGNIGFQGPAVMISNADGVNLKNYIDANSNQSVTIDLAGMEMDLSSFDTAFQVTPPLAANQVASYSSFGPAPDGSLKPDIVATGGLDGSLAPAAGMYVAAQNYDPTIGADGANLYSANRYAAADGTSFSTPLVAGAAALVKQAHPTYSSTQIKSALVNSAAQDTTTDDGHVDASGTPQSPQPVTAQWLGAGRLDAGAALNATLTVEPATISFGYLKSGSLPITKALTITNKGASSVTVTVAVPAAPSGATLAADQSSFTLAAGANTTLHVTLSGTVPTPGSYTGAVTLSVGTAVVSRVPYLALVPDGVPHNIVPLAGTLQGIPGQDSGSMAVQILDQYGVPVVGTSVAFSVSPKGAVTFQTAPNEPACSAGSTGSTTCNTDNYGIAYAEVILGSTTGSPTITATANNTPFTVNAFILAQPAITPGQVLDNAAFQPTVAPGSIAAIKGTNLMDTDLLINTAQGYDLIPSVETYFPLSLDGVNVSFDVPGTGISAIAPVVAVSAGQINVQVPWELKGQTSAQVKVIVDELFGQPIYSAPVTVQLADYTPAFFTNNGNPACNGTYCQADALDANYHVITPGNAAVRGQFISLYANGLGPVSSTPADGFGAGATSNTTTPCVVTIGGQTLSAGQVPFCGLAPGLAIYQINVQVPANLTPGNQPITVTIGGKTSSSSVMIPVQ
jgi:minor extracellular serine protease Vpr